MKLSNQFSRNLALSSILSLVTLSAHAQTSTDSVRYDITFDEASQGFVHGSLFTGDEFADLGGGVTFTVDSNGSFDQLITFDTGINQNNTTDPDLVVPFEGGNLGGNRKGLPALGNALIIAENLAGASDGIANDPDDERRGGVIGVVFGNDRVESVGFSLYDTPENSRSAVSITFTDSSGDSVVWDPNDLIAHGTDVEFGNRFANEFEDITAAQLGLTNIQSIDFKIESGAIDSINFVEAVPEPSSFALLGLGAVGCLLRRKRA